MEKRNFCKAITIKEIVIFMIIIIMMMIKIKTEYKTMFIEDY